jgi:hypothetical protein
MIVITLNLLWIYYLFSTNTAFFLKKYAMLKVCYIKIN